MIAHRGVKNEEDDEEYRHGGGHRLQKLTRERGSDEYAIPHEGGKSGKRYGGRPYIIVGRGGYDARVGGEQAQKLLTPEEVAQNIKFFVDASQQVNGVKLQINAGTQLI